MRSSLRRAATEVLGIGKSDAAVPSGPRRFLRTKLTLSYACICVVSYVSTVVCASAPQRPSPATISPEIVTFVAITSGVNPKYPDAMIQSPTAKFTHCCHMEVKLKMTLGRRPLLP